MLYRVRLRNKANLDLPKMVRYTLKTASYTIRPTYVVKINQFYFIICYKQKQKHCYKTHTHICIL